MGKLELGVGKGSLGAVASKEMIRISGRADLKNKP